MHRCERAACSLSGDKVPCATATTGVVELALVAERVSKITRANPGLKVLVEGDATIAYGRVIDLMDRLQKVGVQDVGLITQPPSR